MTDSSECVLKYFLLSAVPFSLPLPQGCTAPDNTRILSEINKKFPNKALVLNCIFLLERNLNFQSWENACVLTF